MFKGKLVDFFVALHARGMHGGAFAGVEHMVMHGGVVRYAAHGSAQRVNFAHNLPFSDAADRRITGHLRHRIQALGDEQRFGAQLGGRQRGFTARVAAADNDDIVFFFANKHLFPHAELGKNNPEYVVRRYFSD